MRKKDYKLAYFKFRSRVKYAGNIFKDYTCSKELAVNLSFCERNTEKLFYLHKLRKNVDTFMNKKGRVSDLSVLCKATYLNTRV